MISIVKYTKVVYLFFSFGATLLLREQEQQFLTFYTCLNPNGNSSRLRRLQ